LRNATAKGTKVQRSSGGGGDTAPRAGGDDPHARRSLSPEDPWASAAPAQPGEPPF
jgi:hypothetical protein